MGISAAFAAVMAGTATVVEIATVVSVVGTGLSVVGAVTGDQKLAKIGAVMSLAGGITSLAASAFSGAAAGTTALAGTAEAGTAFADFGAIEAAAINADAAATAAGAAASSGGGGMLNFGADTALGSADMGLAQPLLEGGGGAVPEFGANAVEQSMGAIPDVPTVQGTPAPQVPGAGDVPITPEGSATSGLGDGYSSATDISGTGPVAAPPDTSSPGWFDKWLGGFDKQTQGRIVSGLVQAGGSAVGGLFSGWSAEQRLALDKEAQQFKQQQYNTAISNANAQPVISFKPVTGMLAQGVKK